jgi:cytochrome P450
MHVHPQHAHHPDAFRLYGPDIQRDPATIYREMRARYGPVAPVLLEGDLPAWLVLGYREVHYVTSSPELFRRDSRRWNRWPAVPADWPGRTVVEYMPSVYYAEGAEHHRRAGAVHDILAAVDQLTLREECERIADRLIDAFAGDGKADLITLYASQLPLFADAFMFGLSPAETEGMVRDANTMVSGTSESIAARERLRALMAVLVQRGRERPGPNLPSRLVAHPAGLTDAEMIDDLGLIIGAGQLTMAMWIGNALRLMLVDDRFSLTLAGGRRSIGQALNEVLWEDTPIQNFAGRWAVRATELGGQRIQAGDMLILGLAAANADPMIREQSTPSAAGNRSQLSFSHGEHRCPLPAQEIAEVVAQTAIEVLLDRLPDLSLAVDRDALVWLPSPWLRGPMSLPVVFTPA